ncbi:uncharacterized protein K460DRAFT_284360 [Cucurbitaria berberidis CBS 394.84]|uniref:Diphthamide biosynthesis protein 4 n=1 Tax=Cucurbitaria berberidis CBS 394.84 TaxID=1168544 RepID=A0A9P4GHP5_9PLEO|nr:uncharacterized protein K460DRAFT_284360 [Cucurbitaria berberidis CBS 394.84]KAF1845775.1 hypothetical protein K460DRAFT_284360 [Cucurbitaria berberidis CBS 394.84]
MAFSYTKNYYHILGLEAPSWGTKDQGPAVEVRRAYKIALLTAHPDKTRAATPKTKAAYTVDDVKEAYMVLADRTRKAEYDNWLLHNGDTLHSSLPLSTSSHLREPSTDFILGLELLDLSDFDVVETTGTTTTPSTEEGTGAMEWTRPCRCGADKGFRILEEELEDAETRGEKEVLVGCEGCSLWLRVAFDVEEG